MGVHRLYDIKSLDQHTVLSLSPIIIDHQLFETIIKTGSLCFFVFSPKAHHYIHRGKNDDKERWFIMQVILIDY